MDLINDFIRETFGGKESTPDQLKKDYHNLLDQIKREIAEKDERIRRLLTACQTWEEKARLAEEALEVACEEVENESNIGQCPNLHHDTGWMECTITNKGWTENCTGDQGVCWKKYFLQRGQENVDREKNNQEVKDGTGN